MKADEPQVGERYEDVERKWEYYHLNIFPIGLGFNEVVIALRPFKIYCASPSITSQLVLFLWKTVVIGPLGHVRVIIFPK